MRNVRVIVPVREGERPVLRRGNSMRPALQHIQIEYANGLLSEVRIPLWPSEIQNQADRWVSFDPTMGPCEESYVDVRLLLAPKPPGFAGLGQTDRNPVSDTRYWTPPYMAWVSLRTWPDPDTREWVNSLETERYRWT